MSEAVIGAAIAAVCFGVISTVKYICRKYLKDSK